MIDADIISVMIHVNELYKARRALEQATNVGAHHGSPDTSDAYLACERRATEARDLLVRRLREI